MLAVLRKPPQPVYEGKSLSHWLKAAAIAAYPQRFQDSPEQQKANEAIRSAGTNAIPILLRMIRARDSNLTRKFIRWASKQKMVRLPITAAGCMNSVGDQGFRVLGSDAKDAVPALVQIFEEKISESFQDSAVTAMGWIGEASTAAIPCLLRGATNPDVTVRLNAVYGLRLMNAAPDKVVPVLIKALKDSESLVRENAFEALEKFGPDAKSGVPALVAYLEDDDDETRSLATNVLKAIDSQALVKAGAK